MLRTSRASAFAPHRIAFIQAKQSRSNSVKLREAASHRCDVCGAVAARNPSPAAVQRLRGADQPINAIESRKGGKQTYACFAGWPLIFSTTVMGRCRNIGLGKCLPVRSRQ